MTISLQTLLAGLAEAAPDLPVSGIAHDSRRVMPGDVFLAARGTGARHGLQHLEEALARGAVALVWEPSPGVEAPAAAIPDVPVPALGERLGEIAARFHGRPADALFTVGITGTDGKTSTAWLTAQALERLGTPCAYVGTLGMGRLGQLAINPLTTPDPLTLQAELARWRREGVRALAMEVSSHALHQARVAGMRFDVAILTNLTRDHLDYHGTEAAYAEAKFQLFARYCRGVSVLNRDDAWGRRWLAEVSDPLAYGLDGPLPSAGDALIGRDLRLSSAGLSLRLVGHHGEAALSSPLLGRFNAYNLLAAAAALRVGGYDLTEAARALQAATTVPGRMEGYRAPGKPLVVVDYAHTPNALRAVLQAARAHAPEGRLTVVFGCGGDRDRGKRPLMGAAAAEGADRVILTDDNPRSEDPAAIVADILAGMPAPVPVIHDRAEAIARAIAESGPQDVVLVAGKGHEATQTVGGERRAFSDRACVAALLGLEPRP